MKGADDRERQPLDSRSPRRDDALLALLARERAGYDLPPRPARAGDVLRVFGARSAVPHFAPRAGAGPHELAAEYEAVGARLAQALATGAVIDDHYAKLAGIREALVLDARAICDGDPVAQSVDEVILGYPGFLATATYRIAHELNGRVAVVPRC